MMLHPENEDTRAEASITTDKGTEAGDALMNIGTEVQTQSMTESTDLIPAPSPQDGRPLKPLLTMFIFRVVDDTTPILARMGDVSRAAGGAVAEVMLEIWRILMKVWRRSWWEMGSMTVCQQSP